MKKFLKKRNTGFTHQNFLRKISGGFTLVETLVAVSIFSLSVLTLMSFLSQGVSNTGYAKKKMIAVYLAQEGIEYIRNIRDHYVLYTDLTSLEWSDFVSKISMCDSDSSGCGFDNSVSTSDADFLFLCSSHVDQCGLYLDDGNYNANSEGEDSNFTRKIYIETIGSNEVKISSTVSLEQDGISYDVTLTEELFNWIE